ncbi:hypothetical protein SDC9_118034 [bioreactor metagenome]|uniref:NodB homology domain-containing protein n=1 Tax=bioreactor metagenome TaxID=1076179 RepID=A0A645C294_9ZZZZ
MSLYFLSENYQASAATQGIPVLLYHRVGYSKDYLTVTPEKFNRDLVWLIDNGYQTISLAQFNNFMAGNSINLPKKPVLITFDDGYVDNYENAYFSLLNYGMVAAFFIITGLLWTPGRVSPENIREMQKKGMSFGSHTMSHRSLSELPLADVEEELNGSRTTLESVLGIPINSIAYPRGSYSTDVLKASKQAGYSYGFTTMYGTCSSGTPSLELCRIPVFSYDGSIASVISSRRYG